MKKIRVFFAAFVLAHPAYPQFNPPNSGPYRSLLQDAGADCIFALHTDTISGMTCANTSVDGTTETVFQHGVTIPAKTLSNATLGLEATFLIVQTSGITITFSLRLCSTPVSNACGTQIFKSSAITSGASVTRPLSLFCTISAVGSASAATPVIVNCTQANSLNGVANNTLLTGSSRFVSVDATTSKVLVWTAQYSANTASNAIGLYSMFNGIK